MMEVVMGLMHWEAALVIITAIYTAGTLALWYTTHRSYKAMRDAFKLNFIAALHAIQRSPTATPPRDGFLHLQNEEYTRVKFETLLFHAFPDLYEEFIEKSKTSREQQTP
jgi:hypothetical protein